MRTFGFDWPSSPEEYVNLDNEGGKKSNEDEVNKSSNEGVKIPTMSMCKSPKMKV